LELDRRRMGDAAAEDACKRIRRGQLHLLPIHAHFPMTERPDLRGAAEGYVYSRIAARIFSAIARARSGALPT
jgi:hypothetical protein